jgi:hypothetical protein
VEGDDDGDDDDSSDSSDCVIIFQPSNILGKRNICDGKGGKEVHKVKEIGVETEDCGENEEHDDIIYDGNKHEELKSNGATLSDSVIGFPVKKISQGITNIGELKPKRRLTDFLSRLKNDSRQINGGFHKFSKQS